MSVDLSLLSQGVKPLQLNDPLEEYGNALKLQGAGTENALNRLKLNEGNALNKATTLAINPVTKQFDPSMVPTLLAADPNGGSSILAYQKALRESQTAQSALEDQQAKTYASTIGNLARYVGNIDPDSKDADIAMTGALHSMATNPILAPQLSKMGFKPEDHLAGMAEAKQAGTLPAWIQEHKGYFMDIDKQLANHINEVNNGNTVSLVQTNANGPANPRTIYSTPYTAHPNTTTVNVGAPKVLSAMDQALGKAASDELVAARRGALEAKPNIDRLDRIADAAESGSSFTGMGAGVKLNIARALVPIGINLGDPEKAASSQTFNKDVAQGVLSAVQDFRNQGGTGFRWNQKEFEQLQAAAISPNLEPGAIERIANVMRRLNAAKVDYYNQRIQDLTKTNPEGIRTVGYSQLPTVGNRVPLGAGGLNIPPAAMELLRNNQNAPDPHSPGHTYRQTFEAKWPGAAARILGEN